MSSDNDVVLFIKAYSLKRTTIQGTAHAKPDEEATVGDATASGGAGAGADATDENSDGHKASLKGGPGEQDHVADVIDEKKRTDGSEKV